MGAEIIERLVGLSLRMGEKSGDIYPDPEYWPVLEHCIASSNLPLVNELQSTAPWRQLLIYEASSPLLNIN